MKIELQIISLCAALIFSSSADPLLYEGFGYGDVTGFVHNVANPNAAGGVGFSANGWRQYNATVTTDGLVGTSTGVYASAWLTASDGYMKINGGGAGNTWALRSISPTYPMHTDQTYYFSVVLRDEDTDTSHGTDGTKLFLRSGTGSTIAAIGFADDEALLAMCGGSSVKGAAVISKGKVVTLVGKLVLSESGTDTLYVSSFSDAAARSEPVSWDLSVSTELAWATFAEIGLNVNGGNSEVDFDEIRFGFSFEDVVPLHKRISLVVFGAAD
jgi:hypothetical protein